MLGTRQGWLVAVREMRERSRTRAFRISLVLMVVIVVAVIVLPSVLTERSRTRDVGLTGSVPSGLAAAVRAQARAIGLEAHVSRFPSVAAGERAVRDGAVDVLVVDGLRLEWRHAPDQELRAVATGAVQAVALRERAAAAGIGPGDLARLTAPVPVHDVELGQVAGRGPDDANAALVMTVLLFMALATYGAMVLSGVVEEKSSRVVEVLLARMPARNLLAGKVAGIGLLGLAQFGVTGVAAVVALASVGSLDMPAVRASVLVWVLVWFLLGYALYATVFGALGSLASRIEDAQSASGPVTAVLTAGYVVSFAVIGSPDAAWARVVSYLPLTAPMAMPNRLAMGAAAWWEAPFAALLTVLTVAALVVAGGRVYAGAVLHSGPVLRLREAWRVGSGAEFGHGPAGPVVAGAPGRAGGHGRRRGRR